MYFTIRITELHSNKKKVLDFINKYWPMEHFWVMEKSCQGIEHFHILVQEDITRDAIRQRIKLLWTGNRQYNLKELDEQRTKDEFIPYMCKDIDRKAEIKTYGKTGFKFSVKKNKRKYDLTAQEYKNGVLGKIQSYLKKNPDFVLVTEENYTVAVIRYYLQEGLCLPSKFRCIALAQTLACRRYGIEFIEDMVSGWFS